MSKASEWAKRVSDAEVALNDAKDAEPFRCSIMGLGNVAWVDDTGNYGRPKFHADVARIWKVEDALTLARWILDTFGEESK